MKQLEQMLILDRSEDCSEPDPLYPFALDELLCRHTGQGGPSICHIWRHPRAFIMGIRDSRLPHAREAALWLASQGYDTAVRNSGGAAVPLDLGVVNLSLILPKEGMEDKHFHSDFELMYQLIQAALSETGRTVDKGEIEGAYCPGDYDLSVNGLKFCGIAQRRQSQAYIVQAFVICSGSGQASAQLVRDFYARAAGEGTAPGGHPLVTDDRTASLAELMGLGSDAAPAFAGAVKRVIRAQQHADRVAASSGQLWLPEREAVLAMASELRNRYGVK